MKWERLAFETAILHRGYFYEVSTVRDMRVIGAKKRAGQKSGAGKIISAGNSEIENNCCAEHDSIPAESGKIMFFDIIHKEFYSKD